LKDSSTLEDKGDMFFRNVGINNPATQRNNPEDLSPYKTKAAKTSFLNKVKYVF
jgi:hypothetical protein